jgi:hypothetical protein
VVVELHIGDVGVPLIVRLLLYTVNVAVVVHDAFEAVITSTSLAVGAAKVGTLYVTVVPGLPAKVPYAAVQAVPVILLLSVSVVVALHTDGDGTPVSVILLYTVKVAVLLHAPLAAVRTTTSLAVGAAIVGTLNVTVAPEVGVYVP